MQYKKFIISSVVISIIMAIVNEVIFAVGDTVANDLLLDGTLNVLVIIQKYSWPVVTLLMIFALYKYYVTGSEVLADKIMGQRMVTSIAVFMVIIQSLPLIYSFLTIK